MSFDIEYKNRKDKRKNTSDQKALIDRVGIMDRVLIVKIVDCISIKKK